MAFYFKRTAHYIAYVRLLFFTINGSDAHRIITKPLMKICQWTLTKIYFLIILWIFNQCKLSAVVTCKFRAHFWKHKICASLNIKTKINVYQWIWILSAYNIYDLINCFAYRKINTFIYVWKYISNPTLNSSICT